MDQLLSQLLSFPPHPPPAQKLEDQDYDRHITALVKLLNETSASKLVKGVSGGGDLLDILDPAINTLPYLYTLLAHISSGHDGKQTASLLKVFPPEGQLWQRMLDFINHFDPIQVRYVGNEWRRLVETVARVADLSQRPAVAIIPIRTAILRLDPTASCFTSTHSLFARVCLQAKAARQALPILDCDIYHFPSASEKCFFVHPGLLPCSKHDSSAGYITTSSGLSDRLYYQHHLTYFLYGAMLYLAMREWDRALLFLEIVIMSPSNSTASMIQVEAYKKWVLVGLLLKGWPMSMPRTTSSQAAKTIIAIAKPYDTLAQAFKHGNSEKLYAEFHAAQKIWQTDCNLGLVLQVLDAHRRFLILKLEKIYAALPISIVAQQTSPHPENHAETEAYVNSLIASGQLNATLAASSDPTMPSVLRFSTSTNSDGPLAYSEVQQYEDLTQQTAKFEQLANHMRDSERRLELSKEYVDWAKKAKKSKGGGGSSGNIMDSNGFGNDGFGAEEDMLADM